MKEALKALAFMAIVVGFMVVVYVTYNISYNGVNPFQ